MRAQAPQKKLLLFPLVGSPSHSSKRAVSLPVVEMFVIVCISVSGMSSAYFTRSVTRVVLFDWI